MTKRPKEGSLILRLLNKKASQVGIVIAMPPFSPENNLCIHWIQSLNHPEFGPINPYDLCCSWHWLQQAYFDIPVTSKTRYIVL